MRNLAVMTPVLNEAFYLQYWLSQVQHFADQIIISDGGSTDGTAELIKEWVRNDKRVVFLKHKQTGRKYMDDWNEAAVRNAMLDKVDCSWCLRLDADELMCDEFTPWWQKLDPMSEVYLFMLWSLWGDVDTVRLSAPYDPRWSKPITFLWHNKGERYTGKGCHARIEMKGSKVIDSNIYALHYHYSGLSGSMLKDYDLRRGDVGAWNPGDKPDPDYLKWNTAGYEVLTAPFQQQHPKQIMPIVNKWKESLRGLAGA